MKLHFVKFLTSRENEIEKKEEGMKLQCLPSLGQAATQLCLRFRSRPPPSIISLSPSTQPHQPASSAAQLPLRHGPEEQYSPAIPSPAVPLLPSFFINYRSGRAGRTWCPASRSSCPAQRQHAAPSSPHPCPPVARLSSTVFRFLPSLGAASPHRAKPQENKDRK